VVEVMLIVSVAPLGVWVSGVLETVRTLRG
jgi:hypothetical protein